METGLIARLEAAVARLEAISSAGPPPQLERGLPDVDAPMDPAITAFDELVGTAVARVKAAAGKIGGMVQEATAVLEEAFGKQKELLLKAKQTVKPDLPTLQEFLKPLNEVILKANALTEGRRSEFFNHLKAASDSLMALAWIAYTGKDCGMPLPISHVEDSWQMAEFYNNKILVEFRNKDPDHVEWAKALKELYLPGLRDFVKKYYPLGPVWSSGGTIPTSSSAYDTPASITPSSSSSTNKMSVSAEAPSLPSEPKAPVSVSSSSSSPASKTSASKTAPRAPASSATEVTVSKPKEGAPAIFRELTSGKPVTAGLRKVTDDMKTKNRSDRTGVVEAVEKDTTRRSSFSFKTGPPKMELQMGRKWVVENQIGKKNLIIDDCDPKQSVYIFSCKDSVLQIKGKVNNITFDKCTKMGLLFTDVVAACEIVNCNSVEVQCQGSVPTVSIDNTAGCQLYLSKSSLGAPITTAKSSEINVMVPGADPDQDWAECALPQQYVHLFKDGCFTTTPASHSGG